MYGVDEKSPRKKIIQNMIAQAEQDEARRRRGRNIVSLRELCNNRNNLLLGSGCEAGLLFRAVVSDQSEKEIEEIAGYFDFIEVQPHMNNKYLLADRRYPNIQTEQDLININLKLILLGEKLNIPVVATGDVHYLKKKIYLAEMHFWHLRGMLREMIQICILEQQRKCWKHFLIYRRKRRRKL